jgi:asparagine synthetase B (glutamine-hydrolysing)
MEHAWQHLVDECTLDRNRIWSRNLARDDRTIADQGREVRLPFLDEDVVELAHAMPWPVLVDPFVAKGAGEKRPIRALAHLLGVAGAAQRPKRALQFGSRSAKVLNKVSFEARRRARGWLGIPWNNLREGHDASAAPPTSEDGPATPE